MKKIRVGIVGASIGRGWAANAHIPALRALPQFEITALATTRQASADEAARHYGIPLAFGDAGKLAAHPDIDLVAVTVKVPGHYDAVMAALDAGKHVFCEWPLALDSAQASRMFEMARAKGLLHVVGLQARCQPAVVYLKDLLAEGYLGEVLSCSMLVSNRQWGTQTDRAGAYLFDRANGATLLTIPGGHSLDALAYCLGEFREVSAVLATRRPEATLTDTGEKISKTAPDQIAISAVLESGAVAAIQVRGNDTQGTQFLFEIQGTGGHLTLTGSASVQYGTLALRGAQGQDEPKALPVPARYTLVGGDVPPGAAFSVAQVYAGFAASLESGIAAAPGFDVALARHRMIEAIQKASDTGRRVTL